MDRQSRCQNQKNTIDPEKIITQYGADSARLFNLIVLQKKMFSGREGIISSPEFYTKIMDLNLKIIEKIKQNKEKDEDDELAKFTNKFLKEITENLENFSYNKIIANLHVMNSSLTKIINKNYKALIKIMKILISMQ